MLLVLGDLYNLIIVVNNKNQVSSSLQNGNHFVTRNEEKKIYGWTAVHNSNFVLLKKWFNLGFEKFADISLKI